MIFSEKNVAKCWRHPRADKKFWDKLRVPWYYRLTVQHDIPKHVGDHPVPVDCGNFTQSMLKVLKLFKQRGKRLTFKYEVRRNDMLQFLDL